MQSKYVMDLKVHKKWPKDRLTVSQPIGHNQKWARPIAYWPMGLAHGLPAHSAPIATFLVNQNFQENFLDHIISLENPKKIYYLERRLVRM